MDSAIARSLSSMGIEVHAVEARPELPGVHTSAATVHEVSSLAGPALIRALLELADRIQSARPPVLFLTNDGMVRDVAAGWTALEGRYRLSWAESRDEVASLLAKTEHERASVRAGCRYQGRWCWNRHPVPIASATSWHIH